MSLIIRLPNRIDAMVRHFEEERDHYVKECEILLETLQRTKTVDGSVGPVNR